MYKIVCSRSSCNCQIGEPVHSLKDIQEESVNAVELEVMAAMNQTMNATHAWVLVLVRTAEEQGSAQLMHDELS